MSKASDSYDFLVKVVIIGDSAVGKTNILLRYTDDLYRATHTATIGVDFKVKTLNVGGTKIKMQIWDTAGQDRFRNITKTYYKGSAGVVFVYSITDRKSFQNLENWIKQVEENQSNDIAKLILGNKIDCKNEGRQVTFQEVEKLSAKFGIPFMEVSAKDNINIQQAFMKMGQLIKENHKQTSHKETDLNGKPGTQLLGQGSKKKNCQC